MSLGYLNYDRTTNNSIDKNGLVDVVIFKSRMGGVVGSEVVKLGEGGWWRSMEINGIVRTEVSAKTWLFNSTGFRILGFWLMLRDWNDDNGDGSSFDITEISGLIIESDDDDINGDIDGALAKSATKVHRITQYQEDYIGDDTIAKVGDYYLSFDIGYEWPSDRLVDEAVFSLGDLVGARMGKMIWNYAYEAGNASCFYYKKR